MHQRRLFLFIIIVAIAKAILSCFLELGNDEVYYLTYARQIQLNYFDHPPVIAIVLKFFSADLLLKNEIFLRLGFIVCGAISTWLIFQIGKKLFSEIAGWAACFLFTASIYANFISGFMIMPDAPMLLFWLWSFYLALNVINERPRLANKSLLLFGVAAGIACMSKVSAVMLWAGFAIYVLLYRRKMLSNIHLYLSAGITFIIASPILIWSIANKSAGAAYHANRIHINQLSAIHPQYLLQQILGEIAYINPIVYFLVIAGMIYCIKKRVLNFANTRLLFCMTIPLIAFVWFSALYNPTLPHWTGPSYVLLSLFAAAAIAHKKQLYFRSSAKRSLIWANAITVFSLAFIVFSVHALPYAFNAKSPAELGKNDLLIDFSGWKNFRKEFGEIYKNDLASGAMKQDVFLLGDFWFPAAHLDWYVAQPLNIPLKTVGSLNDIHQYAWLNKTGKQLKPGNDAYFIGISNYYRDIDTALLNSFAEHEEPQVLFQYRAGIPVRKFYIIRLKNYKGGIDERGVTYRHPF